MAVTNTSVRLTDTAAGSGASPNRDVKLLDLGDNTLAYVSTLGGNQIASVAAAAAAAVIATGKGRLCKVIITTSGTAALTFYDNSTNGATTGNILGAIPASATVGTIYDFQTPYSTGISPSGGLNTPAYTVTYY